MEEWGNERANQLYEANLPANFVRPKEGDAVRVVEKFIREKYEQKKYMARTIPEKISRAPVIETVEIKEPIEEKKRPAKAPAVTPVQTVAPVASVQPSLLDFMDDPQPISAPAAQTTTQQQSFSAFDNPSQPVQASNDFQQFQQASVSGFDFTNTNQSFSSAQPASVTKYYFIILISDSTPKINFG